MEWGSRRGGWVKVTQSVLDTQKTFSRRLQKKLFARHDWAAAGTEGPLGVFASVVGAPSSDANACKVG